MYSDNELLPISGLQHLVFCPRQCALIHVERAWAENELTVAGQILHKKTNLAITETHRGNRILRSIDLVSFRLGLVGKSDIVEFHPPPGVSPTDATRNLNARLENQKWEGWSITPVEYKRGRPKINKVWGDCDRIQLCAQALCIEEMMGITISMGQLFYGLDRRRIDVPLDGLLRAKTEECANRLHSVVRAELLPSPVNDRRCKRCSLKTICMPSEVHSPTRASRWLSGQIAKQMDDEE